MNNEIQDKIVNEKRNYVVYKHTSPNGKVYIGITGQNPPEKRWGSNGNGYSGQNDYFCSAIKKYGWDNFSHEILLRNLTQEEAEQKEIELISFYESTNREYGYNVLLGGKGGSAKTSILQYSKDFEFIRRWDGAIDAEDEIGICASMIASCCRDKIPSAGGYIWRYEFPDDVKKNPKGHTNPDTYKPVDQYSLTGEFIATYIHITEASSETGVDESMISKSCNGNQRKAGGFLWRYHGDELTEKHIEWCNGTGREDARIPVSQYSKDGNLIKTWNSFSAIQKELGYDASAIIRCCKGEQKTSYGFIWRYADSIFNLKDINLKNKKAPKKVIQYTLSGEYINTFNSVKEASRALGIDDSSIGKTCKGKYKHTGGYIWRYADDENNEFREAI